jgi:hypothetical protein
MDPWVFWVGGLVLAAFLIGFWLRRGRRGREASAPSSVPHTGLPEAGPPPDIEPVHTPLYRETAELPASLPLLLHPVDLALKRLSVLEGDARGVVNESLPRLHLGLIDTDNVLGRLLVKLDSAADPGRREVPSFADITFRAPRRVGEGWEHDGALKRLAAGLRDVKAGIDELWRAFTRVEEREQRKAAVAAVRSLRATLDELIDETVRLEKLLSIN